jgi:Asp-tRNA(Asn)/Glu-tRNA(Gln) amidotransferase A subunit family amidase
VSDNPALAIATQVVAGTRTARAIAETTLAHIAKRDSAINAFTHVTAERALAEAAQVDEAVAAGRNPGTLAGVPFAVKDLFDIAGVATKAGSSIHAGRPPAARDAMAIRRLRAAGAILVGALNMEEYAYGFYTDNPHHGRTLNPSDATRTAGGSSGGSAAAVAAGLVPFALGLGHQWLDPRAVCVLWNFRAQADIWPPQSRRFIIVRLQPRSHRANGSRRRRSCGNL